MPLPAHDVEPVLEIFDHTQFDGLFGGHVFWDGSATKPAIPELSRAAWAAVVTDDEGTMLARLRGAVPRTLPQTSQAAEVMGVCRSVPRFRKPTVGYEDCLNVFEATRGLMNGEVGALAKGMYAAQYPVDISLVR